MNTSLGYHKSRSTGAAQSPSVGEHGTPLPDATADATGDATVRQYLSWGCSLVALLLPLKLSLTYIALSPLLVLWLYQNGRNLPHLLTAEKITSVTAPLCFFLMIAALSLFAGLSPLHSAPSLLSLFFFALTVPLFTSSANPIAVCTALVAGQSLAGLHSFFDALFPGTLPKFFLGKVTESGQLSLSILVACGLYLSLLRATSTSGSSHTLHPYWRYALGGILTAALLALVFHHEAGLSTPLVILSIIVSLGLVAIVVQLTRKASSSPWLVTLPTIQIPLLICALVVNLKRGPWLGVLVGIVVLCALYARRLVVVVLACAAIMAASITPVRERLLASYDHFTISGGRSTIWRIGIELASEYPLGIGYHNSGILREFAPEIPPELKHFHNNLINVAAEMGWLGLATFAWLLIAIVRICFKDRGATLYVAIGCAIISWQVAGLVEYNFGDSEVTLVVWALIGLLLQRELRVL